MATMSKPRKPSKSAPEPPRDPEAMTGEQFAKARAAFGLSQSEMATELGLGLRTVIRFEASAGRTVDIPLAHAKHVRCLARERRIPLK